MKRPLYVAGAGAVTPAGLNARQTIAAVRASLSAFEEITLAEPFGMPQVVARIPTHRRLRRSEGEWLVNMAARAIAEALGTDDPGIAAATALLITTPESFRNHPAFADIPARDFLAAVLDATGLRSHPASRVIDGGAAASVGLLDRALALMEEQGVAQVLLGGVDSLVNDIDLARLGQAGRLKSADNAQGLVPGEAAVFVRLLREPGREPVVAAIHGVGTAQETDSVLSDRYSQGRAMLGALRDAVAGSGPSEPDIDFVVSNGNGERYQGWEMLISRPRFYRTRRDLMATAYPAMTLGDVGAAGGALALMLAADSFVHDYAPGPIAMCEVASEGGLRAAAVMARATRG
jgi:3-oxoacyl-[acyl-carrier-protein] synthase-1